MVGLPDIERDFTQPPQDYHEPTGLTEHRMIRLEASILLRALCGVALVAAGFGIWIMPTGAGDPAMMLIKLVVSLTLFWAGMLCLAVFRGDRRSPEVEIDSHARQLRVIHPQPGARPPRTSLHDFDDLEEISLRDRMLTARDRQGRRIVSLHLHDARSERMLRNALSLAG